MMRALLTLLALVLAPAVAWADPATITVAWAAVAEATGSLVLANAVEFVMLNAASFAVAAAAVYGNVDARRRARRAANAARAAYNASLTDRTVTILQSDPPQRVVYGRAQVGGAIVAIFTTDKQGTRTNGAAYTKPDALKHLVVVFADHRCAELCELTLDGDPVGLSTLDAGGWATTGEFAGTQSVRKEVTLPAGASVTAPAAVTVSSCVQAYYQGDGSPADGTYSLSNANKTITNTSTFTAVLSYTYTQNTGSVRVSWHLGTDDQAVDAYLNGLLPDKWPATATLSGKAYAVITLDLENQRFQGGPPGITFDVRGKLVYDPRANQANNPAAAGGAVGILPAGWSKGAPSGLALDVVGAGDDELTGLPYLDVRLTGTAAASGVASLRPMAAATAVAASSGQQWSARWGVRVLAAPAGIDYVDLGVESWSAAGVGTLESPGADASMAVGSAVQWLESTDAGLVASAVGVGMRLRLGVTSGATYDTTLRVLLPQLWQGAIGGAADPVRHTENPALCVADYLRSPQGMSVDYLDINADALIAAANACDQTISLTVDGVTTPGPRYTCNGSYTTDQGRESVLDELCQSMAGWATYGADWIIQAGVWGVSVQALTDADLDGQVAITQAGAPMESLFNGVRSSYMPRGATSTADATYANATLVAADGGVELWTDLTLAWTDNPARVKNLQRIFTEREREGLVISYPAKLTAWPLRVGDRVTVTNTEYGWASKVFRVTDWSWGVGSAVLLTLQEDAEAVWDLADAAFADQAPNTDLPKPWRVAAPTGAAAASGGAHLLRQADGTLLPRVWVSWSAITDAYVADGGRVEILWRRVAQDQPNAWRRVDATGDAVGEYLLGARSGDVLNIILTNVNSLGARSDQTHLSHVVVGKEANPRNVTGLDAQIVYGAVRIRTDGAVDADFDALELRVGSTWDSGTPLVGAVPTRVRGTEYLWAWPAYGTYTVWAKYVDTSGFLSTTAASVLVVVNDAIKLGSDGIDVDLAGVNLCPNSSFEIGGSAGVVADGWTLFTAGTTGTVGVAPGAGRIKGSSQAVSGSAMGGGAGDRIGMRRNISVGAGAIQALCASAYVAGSSGRSAVLVAYAVVDGGGVVGTASATVALTGTTAWKRLAAQFSSFPATADRIDLYIYLTGTGSSVFLIDDVLVEEASLPSAWHPSPLDELIDTGMLDQDAATERTLLFDAAGVTYTNAT